MQMFADVFGIAIRKTSVDQDAASLGAAAIAFVGTGLWEDYSGIPALHKLEGKSLPDKETAGKYSQIFPVFEHANAMMSGLGGFIHSQPK
jgi:xylulokinase